MHWRNYFLFRFHHFSASPEPFDTDKMAMEFSMQFVNKAFSEGQSLAFNYAEKKLLSITVKSIEGIVLFAVFLLYACWVFFHVFIVAS